MKKTIAKKCSAFVLAFLLSFSTLFTMSVDAKEYENKYDADKVIEQRPVEDYEAMYTVNNLPNDKIKNQVVLYFVTQDYFNVEQNDFMYKFEGSFTPVEKWGSHLFEFDLGYPFDYDALSTVTLGSETAPVYKAHFGVYPGYYNFYNWGSNYVGYGAGTACFIKTLSPNGLITEEDRFTKTQWIEIKEEDSVTTLYALVGEKEWIEKVEKDFEAWAKDYDEKLDTNIIEQPLPTEAPQVPEEIEEDVDLPTEVEEDSEEQRAIYSVNPRHYNEVKNDESIEDVVSRVEVSTLPDSDEAIGSVTYVAVDGLGEPYGMGAHYLDYSVGCAPNPKEGYRFVTAKASNIKFHKVKWDERNTTYNYWFLVPEGDVTIYCYYELKDYSITVDEELKGYLEYPPYADEGEMIKYCFEAPGWYSHNQVQFRLEDGTTQDIEPIKKDDGCYYFEMPNYNITLELKSDAQTNNNATTEKVEESIGEKTDKPNVALPIAVVGVVSVGTIAGVTYHKKRK